MRTDRTALLQEPILGEVEASEAQGWLCRFTIEVERTTEHIQLHESLRHEVRVLPVTADSLVDEECATCLSARSLRYMVIYTRAMDE